MKSCEPAHSLALSQDKIDRQARSKSVSDEDRKGQTGRQPNRWCLELKRRERYMDKRRNPGRIFGKEAFSIFY